MELLFLHCQLIVVPRGSAFTAAAIPSSLMQWISLSSLPSMFTEIPQDLKEFCFLHSLQAEKFVGSTNISYFRVCFLAIQYPIPMQSFVSSLEWFIPTHVSSLDVTSKTTRDYSCVRVSLLPHHILYTVHNMTLVCIPNKKLLSKVQCSPTTFQRVFCQFFSFIPAICHDHSRDTYVFFFLRFYLSPSRKTQPL